MVLAAPCLEKRLDKDAPRKDHRPDDRHEASGRRQAKAWRVVRKGLDKAAAFAPYSMAKRAREPARRAGPDGGGPVRQSG